MREPKNSCPDINSIQHDLQEGIKELESVDVDVIDWDAVRNGMQAMQNAINEMEAVRKINEELREYANHWRQEYDNQLREIADLERLVESLEDERNELRETVEELKAQQVMAI